ncbi:MAG: hypothetical protein LBV49_06750 [Azonexus sp.]|jgi:hypothetical protein|nr:hypothetical protein [Azonexus sp.]
MKYIILAALLFGAALNPALAQTNKKTEIQPLKIERAENLQPFSLKTLEAGRIDPGFTGVSASAIVDAIDAIKNIKKGEFESTEEFESRKSEAYTKKIIGNIGLGDLFPIVVQVGKYDSQGHSLGYSYDADATEVIWHLNPQKKPYKDVFVVTDAASNIVSKNSYLIERVVLQVDRYQANNAFGAVVEVEKTSMAEYHFVVDTVDNLKNYYNATVPFGMKMDAKTATKELPALKILLIVKLKSPYLLYMSENRIEPTFKSPRGFIVSQKPLFGDIVKIIFYSGVTGKIFAQFPDAAENTAAPSAPQDSMPKN